MPCTGGIEPATPTVSRAPGARQSESVRDVESDDHRRATDHDPPCFTVRQDDSSGNVTETGAECTSASGWVNARLNGTPASADDALRLGIKLAIDAEDYERASTLLDVLKRAPKTASVRSLTFNSDRTR
jgi:hypothetical protein